MNITDSQRLLAEYLEGSEPAFRELVSRYLDLVYSTAIRLVNGDSHRAEDVTQTVFVDLARKARTLSSDVMLGGWLHRHTCFVAANAMRTERRRQSRERQAVEMNALDDHSEANLAQIAPILDEAINQLNARDRTAILLRFFEQNDLRAVGQALNSSENAAQKCVARALEKLRGLLKNRGVTFSATALGTVLAAEAVTAAPAGLAVSISSTALAGAAATGATAFTLLKVLTMSKIKLGIISAIVIAGIATPFVMQHQSQEQLRGANASLQEEVTELTQLKAENERLKVAPRTNLQPASEPPHELIKLRNEVGLLRQRNTELERLWAGLAANANLPKQDSNAIPDEPMPRETWKFAGYDTPQATAQSFIWAEAQGDWKGMMAAATPGMQEIWQAQIDKIKETTGKTADDFMTNHLESMDKVKGFRIAKSEVLSDDQMLLHVHTEGPQQENVVVIMKKIDNEWKIDTSHHY